MALSIYNPLPPIFPKFRQTHKHIERREREREMLTCIPCPSTRGLIRDITHHIKLMSLKAMRKTPRPKETTTMDVNAVREDEVMKVGEEEEEWVAEVEHGILITLVSLPGGGNYIKKIRFSEDLFNTSEAQKWWTDNYNNIMELYNIHQALAPPPTPHQSDDEGQIDSTQVNELEEWSSLPHDSEASIHILDSSNATNDSEGSQSPSLHLPLEAPAKELSATSCTGEIQGKVVEWVVEDEPGIFLTFHLLADSSKELMRVELSRERFGEAEAKIWWEENKARLQQQQYSQD